MKARKYKFTKKIHEEKNNKIYEELKEEKEVNIEEFNIERESIIKRLKKTI